MPKGGPSGKVTRRLEDRFEAERRRVALKRAAAQRRLESRGGAEGERDRAAGAGAQNTVGTFGK